MPIHLLVLRHAKSSWKDANLRDFERPLNGRGKREAAALGHELPLRGWVPDRVLCSTAVRAQQTLERLGLALPESAVQLEDELYDASPGDWLKRIRETPADVGMLLVIGHNPTLEDLIHELVGRVAPELKTCHAVLLSASGPWSAAGSDDSPFQLEDQVRGREL